MLTSRNNSMATAMLTNISESYNPFELHFNNNEYLNNTEEKEHSNDSEMHTFDAAADSHIFDISLMSIADDNHDDYSLKDMQKTLDEGIETFIEQNQLESIDLHSEQTITNIVQVAGNQSVIEAEQVRGIRVAFGIILRLMLPLANGVARSIQSLRDARFLSMLKSIATSRQALTSLVAFTANTISMNLSAVQVSHRIDPILKLFKLRKSCDGLESLPDIPSSGNTTPSTPTSADVLPLESPFFRTPNNAALPHFSGNKRKLLPPEEPAANCCSLNILAEPAPGQPIRADIVFIHGLHGSLVNTWKQGLWENERKPLDFNRPPKPPVRPPKRVRHSRSTVIRPPHKLKRARFAHLEPSSLYRESEERDAQEQLGEFLNANLKHQNDDDSRSHVCGEPTDIQICDGIEYSIPKFRLRIKDNGRLLQAEIESILKDNNLESTQESATNSEEENSKKEKTKTKAKAKAKPSVNDPDYSKCWPGDWLPLDCPGVRVIAINYTTDAYLWRPMWKKKEPRTNLMQRSREMTKLLLQQGVGSGHPIVWVGHSKGGLFVKQIIVDAWESGRAAVAPLWRSSRGCFFYSVPHRGSHLASIKAPLLTRSVELLDIEKNSKYLLDLHRRFAGLYHLGHLNVEVFSFVELALTLMSVLYLRIVGVDSADPGIGDVCGIRLDHREICKPRNRDCILYKELVKMINKVC